MHDKRMHKKYIPAVLGIITRDHQARCVLLRVALSLVIGSLTLNKTPRRLECNMPLDVALAYQSRIVVY
jgi:hypothetical protein